MAAPSTEIHGHHADVAGGTVAVSRRVVLLDGVKQVGKVGRRANLKKGTKYNSRTDRIRTEKNKCELGR